MVEGEIQKAGTEEEEEEEEAEEEELEGAGRWGLFEAGGETEEGREEEEESQGHSLLSSTFSRE